MTLPAERFARAWEAALGLGIDVRWWPAGEPWFLGAYSPSERVAFLAPRTARHPCRTMILAHEVGHALVYRGRPWMANHVAAIQRRPGGPRSMHQVAVERDANREGARFLRSAGIPATGRELVLAERTAWSRVLGDRASKKLITSPPDDI